MSNMYGVEDLNTVPAPIENSLLNIPICAASNVSLNKANFDVSFLVIFNLPNAIPTSSGPNDLPISKF